ncbi:MAG: ABC transporter permease [Anaerolineales bacterium]|nr:ABC transporter permease [Anaerolineales bacterium]MCB9146112.1 ABC transporter permease [Anaerolineales bacterium]
MQPTISWRSFRMAAWLGWLIESNWTDPFLFAVYSIVKPISGAAILVVMYSIISGGNFDNAMFPYIYLGNAFYIYVGAVMTGVSWAVVDDREHYKTLKYMYIAPIHIPLYLLGRGVARFVTGSIAVFITLAAGILFLNVKINFAEVDWLLFFVTLILGVVMLALLGLLLAGVTLTVARHEGFIGEATAGALYIFSGAIFPLDVLPEWLRPIGYFMPTTYWLELLRRSLIGNVAEIFPTLAGFSNLEILGVLFGLSVLFGAVSIWVFRYCDAIARERGLIDRTTNY